MEISSYNNIEFVKRIKIQGRLDVTLLKKLDDEFKHLISEGDKFLILDLGEATYISSAGLRILLIHQKELKILKGELVLFNIPKLIQDVFNLSGFSKIFKVFNTQDELNNYLGTALNINQKKELSTDNLLIKYLEYPAKNEKINLIGDSKKLAKSEYDENDCVLINQNKYKFGFGLGTIGNDFIDTKDFYGESIIINNSLFFYPAMEKSSVDYLLRSDGDTNINYNFLNGIGFNGNFKYILNFSFINKFVAVQELIDFIYSNFENKIYGLIMISESKGFYGMNLKRVPIIFNKSSDNIFAMEEFGKWFNFPVDPTEFNHPILSVGVICPKGYTISDNLKENIFSEKESHIHSIVLDKAVVNYDIEYFEKEITRVITEFNALKVQHLLPKSLFSRGLAGLIELEE